MARCQVCGRRIRSGRKYCYEHRHSRDLGQSGSAHLRRKTQNKDFAIMMLLSIILIMVGIGMWNFGTGFQYKSFCAGLIALGVLIFFFNLDRDKGFEKREIRHLEKSRRRRARLREEVKHDLDRRHR